MEIHSVIKRAFAGFQDYPNDTSPQMDLLTEKYLFFLFFVSETVSSLSTPKHTL